MKIELADEEVEIVEARLNGWRRIKDFIYDPTVKLYLVIPVGRPLDTARYKDGKFIEYEYDWELDVNYWMPIPDTPREMIQWFYGEPNGYRLRTQPPWISEREWNRTLRGERDREQQLEQEHPAGSTITFKPRYHKGKRTGVIEGNSAGVYLVKTSEKETWCVRPSEIYP